MGYKLAVVILLIICFVFAYQTFTNSEEYCKADNMNDRNLALYAMITSGVLSALFLMWAFYEYDSYRNSAINILVLVNKEKLEKSRQDYINAPDPNIESARLRNQQTPGTPETSETPRTPETLETSQIPSQEVPNIVPTSEFNKYQAINASSARGDITEGFER